MVLATCRRLWGQANYIDGDPPVEVYRNVLYDAGGLYDTRRRLLPECSHYRAVPVLHAAPGDPFQKRVTDQEPSAVRAEAADDVYLWGGYLFSHYGHFVVGPLARLWTVPQMTGRRPKILVWGESADHCFAQPFARDLLGQLGIARDDLVSFDRPTRIREVIVPGPSFEENHFVHNAFGRLCRGIAAGLSGVHGERSSTPVYISKARLTSGTAHTINEHQFAERLNRAGIDIFYPEQHSMAEQVRLWQQRSVVTGFLGSAMLTAAFVGRRTVAVVNHEPQVYSNQVLMDRLNDNVSAYYYPHGDFANRGADGSFQFNFEFRDPVQTAEEFLRRIDGLIDGPARPGRRGAVARSVGSLAYVDGPLGTNLSRHRPALQSSVLPPHSRRRSRAGDASHAVDGILDGGTAFHTSLETDPWWSVDLGAPCDLHEVRLYNRLGIGVEHSRNLAILTSLDGEQWAEQHRRTSEQPFGGADGAPYRWLCEGPVLARYVKVQVIGTVYMHLDQIEVFGDGADVLGDGASATPDDDRIDEAAQSGALNGR